MTYTQTTKEIVYDDGFLVKEHVHVSLKLRRCPFCGKKGKVIHTSGEDQADMISIECEGCGGACGEYLTHEEAAVAWNRRARG
ncbi:MAG: Lar family restriction alleviation protein [Synergistaceae bacterium]|nr:Lar family restriction alleviation protein [Synergistaceae bacterium]